MTSTHFRDLMEAYLDGTGNTWSIELETKRTKTRPQYGSPNYVSTWYLDKEHYNKYVLYIVDANEKVLFKSDEFAGHQKNSWTAVGYGNFMRTLKKV